MAVIVFLALAAISGRAYGSEVREALTVKHGGLTEVKASVPAQGIKATLFVTIPVSRLVFRHELVTPIGQTAGGLVASAYKVDRGLVCCDSRDVKSINGIAVDPYSEKWWVVLVNGNKQNSSSRTVLADGDTVEWRFDEKTGYDPMHVRLEDWVVNADSND